MKINDQIFCKSFNKYGIIVGKAADQYVVRFDGEEGIHFFFEENIELVSSAITTVDTQQVWNALYGTDGWQRIVHNFRCQGKNCHMSGAWFTRMDMPPNGEEHYRCASCGQVHIFKVPLGA
jgi:hypothetical protein